MPRTPRFDWHLTDWMAYAKVTQADLCRATGWPKAKMSELVNGPTRYNRDVVNALAKALHVRPYELLMDPDLAHAFRQFQALARKESVTLAYEAPEEESGELIDELNDRESKPIKRGTGTHG